MHLRLSNLNQDDEIKCASEWSGVLNSQRVYEAVRSDKRVAKADHTLYL